MNAKKRECQKNLTTKDTKKHKGNNGEGNKLGVSLALSVSEW